MFAGGGGFPGVSLASHLAATGWRLTFLSRPRPAGPWRHVPWDARTPGDGTGCLAGADGLVDLVGHAGRLSGKAACFAAEAPRAEPVPRRG